MTSWMVGHTDRFRAACSERAVNNFIAEAGSSDIGIWFKSYVGDPLVRGSRDVPEGLALVLRLRTSRRRY